MKRIFLVEDDENFGAVLKAYLELHKFSVQWITDGANAINTFKNSEYDLCILNVMLPNVDGFCIAKEIKQINSKIPLIFLTAKTLKNDVLEGYKTGADDYITKPFDSEVLLYKINAILKRNQNISKDSNNFEIGLYKFDYQLRTLSIENKQKKLSPKEAELLKLLCLEMNNILPYKKALKEIWGDNNYFTKRSMDVYITKLRKYLNEDEEIKIISLHNSGYRLMIKK